MALRQTHGWYSPPHLAAVVDQQLRDVCQDSARVGANHLKHGSGLDRITLCWSGVFVCIGTRLVWKESHHQVAIHVHCKPMLSSSSYTHPSLNQPKALIPSSLTRLLVLDAQHAPDRRQLARVEDAAGGGLADQELWGGGRGVGRRMGGW